jgi:hypothetical protein
MRPRERRESSEQDLFRSRLDQIIDMNHALVKLARTIDWGFLEERFGAVYTDKPGQPPLPTRLMAGLAILKHTYDLSDEALCDRWVENPYFQYFCGEEFFQHALVFDRSSLTRWRQRMGEERLQALLQESLAVATRTPAGKTNVCLENCAAPADQYSQHALEPIRSISSPLISNLIVSGATPLVPGCTFASYVSDRLSAHILPSKLPNAIAAGRVDEQHDGRALRVAFAGIMVSDLRSQSGMMTRI